MDKHIVFMLIHEFSLAYFSRLRRDGGASRDRTDDPLLAKQVLSQLSYGPMLVFLPGCFVEIFASAVTYLRTLL